MLTNEELIAEYTYLDDLDCRGWAWEILRRSDEYRADFNRLHALGRPLPRGFETANLAIEVQKAIFFRNMRSR